MASNFGASFGGRLLILLAVGLFASNNVFAAGDEDDGRFANDGSSSGHLVPERWDNQPILKVVHNRNSEYLNREEMIRRDNARLEWLQSKMIPVRQDAMMEGYTMSSSAVSIPTTYGSGNYLVAVGLGNPVKELHLEMDTGSPITWTQCQPCQTCYNQTDPIFDPSASSTYSNILCPSSTCDNLYGGNPWPCTSDGACSYFIRYGDGSNSSGPLATDTLTLSSVNLVNFIFGCGQDNEGLFGSSDGLFGLSNDGVFSIVTQGASQFGEYFSYCLPSSTTSTGFLVLGNTTESTPNSTSLLGFTPIITLTGNPEFYGINITGISVGGVALSASSSQILMNSSSIIDSGTVITRLPPTVYAEFRSAFQQQMTNYTMVPGDGFLDTCYDFSNYSDFNDITYPEIVISFQGGVDVELGFNGTFFMDAPSLGCLAFATPLPNSSMVIYGNVQQRTFEITYDVANKQLGFWANACS